MTVMSKAKRQDGWWYPWTFVAAFGVIIAVNGTMAYIAVNSWTGLETKQAFQHAQGFNDVLAQKSAQAALGWTALAAFESQPTADSARAGVLRLTINDKHGQGVAGMMIEAKAVRPTHEGYDRALQFTAVGSGVYAAPTTLPLAGQWELRVVATGNDAVFKMRQRILVP